jgi:hypothetical protein
MEVNRTQSQDVVETRSNFDLVTRIFDPIESLSLCKDKEFQGVAGKAAPEKPLPFKKIFMVCEDLIDERDPRTPPKGSMM